MAGAKATAARGGVRIGQEQVKMGDGHGANIRECGGGVQTDFWFGRQENSG